MTDFNVVAGHLQQRIAQLVAQYEGDIAVLKTDLLKQVEDLKAEVKKLTDELAKTTQDNDKGEPTKESH